MVTKFELIALVAVIFSVLSQSQTSLPTSSLLTPIASSMAATVTTTATSSVSVTASSLSSPPPIPAITEQETSTPAPSSSTTVTLSATNLPQGVNLPQSIPPGLTGEYGIVGGDFSDDFSAHNLKVLSFDNFTGINYTWGISFVDVALCYDGVSPNQWARVASLALLPQHYETLSNGNFLLFPIFEWAQYGQFYAVMMACDNPFALLNLTAGCNSYGGENNTCWLRFSCYTLKDWSSSVTADCNATASAAGTGTEGTPFTNCTFPTTFNKCYAVSVQVLSPLAYDALDWVGIDDITIVTDSSPGHNAPFPSAALSQPAWNASSTTSITPITASALGISTLSTITPAVSPATGAVSGGPSSFTTQTLSATVGTSSLLTSTVA